MANVTVNTHRHKGKDSFRVSTKDLADWPLVRTGTVADGATLTPDSANNDIYTVTALAQATTFAVPLGNPTNYQKLTIRIKDNGTARGLSWNSIYRAGTDVALPTTTVISKTLYIGFGYNSTDSKWDLLAVTGNI